MKSYGRKLYVTSLLHQIESKYLISLAKNLCLGNDPVIFFFCESLRFIHVNALFPPPSHCELKPSSSWGILAARLAACAFWSQCEQVITL